MKHLLIAMSVASLTVLPIIAEAQGNSNGNRGNGNGRAGNTLNCPPGLAKKNPPCVPPGLARQGVTTQEYLNYDDDEWQRIIDENDDIIADVDFDGRPFHRLTDEEIADIYGIDPPRDGKSYAVIDGQLVELNDENRLILRQIQTLSDPVETGNNLTVEPTVSLTEDELIAIYDLPEPEDGMNYTVIDGQIALVSDPIYDLLQIIRIATAI